jgi:hypothetical protein
VPAKMPVAGVKVTPPGRVPLMERVGAGTPVAVTVKVPANPMLKVVWLALVMDGPAVTVKVKFCTASGDTPLVAVKVSG